MMLEVARPRRLLRRERRRCTGSTSRSTRAASRTLLGANGAGKTTTLRALCGMVRTERRDPLRRQGASPAGRPRTSCGSASRMCRRGAAPSSRMTVEENLQLGAMTRRDRAGDRRRYRARLRLFPAAQGAPRAAGRHAVRRRAADAGGRPRPDAAAAPDAARRAVLRPGAADRRGAVRDPAPAQPRDRRGDADRRAERGAGARPRRARLPARNRPHRHGRAGRRIGADDRSADGRGASAAALVSRAY